MANGNYNMKPGSKEKDTPGGFSKKQTDTIAKLTPKPKLSRKERKAKEAKEQKNQNYVADSKRVFPEFNQKTDSVVSETGHNTNVIKMVTMQKAKLATLPRRLKPGESTVPRNFRMPQDIKSKMYQNRKTGEYTSYRMVKKNSTEIEKKK